MDSLESYEQLYQKGKLADCFRGLIPRFQRGLPGMRECWLMSKLLSVKPVLNKALLSKVLSNFESKEGLRDHISAKLKGARVDLQNDDEMEIYIELSIAYVRILIDSDLFDECREVLKRLGVVVQILNCEWVTWLVEQQVRMIDDHHEKRALTHDRQNEAAEYKCLMNEQEELEYFKQEGLFGYLIPTKWLKRWKQFAGIEEDNDNEMTNEEVDVFSTSSEAELERFNAALGREGTTIDEEMTSEFPGPVDGSMFYELQWDLLIDPFTPKKHQNYSLRANLAEGKDFVFVFHKLYAFFSKLYGGIEAKRMIISHQHTKKPFVDLQAKSMNFIIVPAASAQKVYTINMGSKETFEAATKKVVRCLGKRLQIDEKQYPASRWWKFTSYECQTEFLNGLEGKKVNLAGKQIPAELIDKIRFPLEELEVSESDVLIFEVKQEREWHLSARKTIPVVQQSQRNNHLQISKLMQDYDISPVPRFVNESRFGLTGLQNLGNTCFMNSALQCLSNVYELTEYMVSNNFVQDLNPKNPIGTRGFLASTYAELMKAIWFGKSSSVSAWELKRVIGKFAPQFYGYGQQDSQELLSYVLDGLHEDLNKILEKPIVEDIDIDKEPDQDAAAKFWKNYLKRNSSKIIDLVAGQFKSTLDCPVCGRKSKTFDPFLSISLPIPNYQLIALQLYVVYADSQLVPLKVQLNLSSDLTSKDVIDQLATMLNLEAHQLETVVSKEHKIKEFVKPTSDVKWIHDHEGMCFVHEVERKQQVLAIDEAFILLSYVQKIKGMLSTDDKALSYTRLLVVPRRNTLADLYLRVYNTFRPHFLMCVRQLEERAFPSQLAASYPEVATTDVLIRELDELARLNKLPFLLKYQDRAGRNKSKEFTINDTTSLQSLSQELKVDLFIADYLRVEMLKLQRCKQHQGNEPLQSDKKKSEYSISDCLQAFTKVETLGKGDEWYCNKCKNHVNAKKKMEVYKAPQILILHLKRFRTNRIHNLGSYYFSGGSQKIGSLVTFPLQGFDLNQFVLAKRDGDGVDYTYDLFGVSNHFGGMGGGHYTAYAFSPIKRQWIDYNDSSVRSASSSDIVSEAAYLLFYRRRDAKPCDLVQSTK